MKKLMPSQLEQTPLLLTEPGRQKESNADPSSEMEKLVMPESSGTDLMLFASAPLDTEDRMEDRMAAALEVVLVTVP
jgi:hypothetical protein